MILPIYTYGSPVLRERTEPIEADSPELQRLIDDMVETMHRAQGLGLAAPQVGRSERVFVIDMSHVSDAVAEENDGEIPDMARGPRAFINPEIVEAGEDDLCEFEEGCLSIPDLREDVTRPEQVRLRYRDRGFQEHEVVLGGMLARVVQHELDHLNGVLFIDRISAFRRRLLRRRLREIAKGHVEADYPLAPPAGA
jgi:peptide deformylase